MNRKANYKVKIMILKKITPRMLKRREKLNFDDLLDVYYQNCRNHYIKDILTVIDDRARNL